MRSGAFLFYFLQSKITNLQSKKMASAFARGHLSISGDYKLFTLIFLYQTGNP